MDRKQLKNNAKELLQKHRWTSVGATALIYALTYIYSSFPFGQMFLGGPVNYGSVNFFLNEKDDVVSIFEGFSHYTKTLLTEILLIIYQTLWSLLFIIPGIIKQYSYALTFYILHDYPELTADEAITKSREMMNGHKWELFVLNLSFLGWDIIGAFTFGVLNILYVMPYKSYAHKLFYEKIKSEN